MKSQKTGHCVWSKKRDKKINKEALPHLSQAYKEPLMHNAETRRLHSVAVFALLRGLCIDINIPLRNSRSLNQSGLKAASKEAKNKLISCLLNTC